MVAKLAPIYPGESISNQQRLLNRLQVLRDTIVPIALAEKNEKFPQFTFQRFNDKYGRRGHSNGEARLENIYADIKRMFPKDRFPLQEFLHREGIRSTLKQILGDDYETCYRRVCKRYGLGEPVQNNFVVAPRRGGKSTGYASLFAAIIANVPGIRIVVFSGGEDTAMEFTQLVAGYLDRIEVKGRIRALRKMTAVIHGQNTVSSVIAFPSGGQASKVSSATRINPARKHAINSIFQQHI